MMRTGLLWPVPVDIGTQAGPASVVKVSLSENQSWMPMDLEVKNQERKVSSCRFTVI
jgi:hypothetical protein